MKNSIITLICMIATISYAQEKLPIDISKSTIKWSGEYTFYFGGHEGTINFSSGHFIKTNGNITGGSFTIDMTSIVSTDIKEEEARLNLENHIKDPDFFDVKNFPKASLVITNVKYFGASEVKLEAKLSIKGITKLVNFNATISYKDKIMTTKFKIDRRRWNIDYTSKLRDGAISDAIGFDVKLAL